jgi:aspartate-semialdehyde dehydrogenase
MHVAVERAHVESVSVDVEENISLMEIRNIFHDAPGLKRVDEWASNHFPMSLEAQKQNDVLIGRLRIDSQSDRTLHFIIAGDQILKGAALNAFQIFEAYTNTAET